MIDMQSRIVELVDIELPVPNLSLKIMYSCRMIGVHLITTLFGIQSRAKTIKILSLAHRKENFFRDKLQSRIENGFRAVFVAPCCAREARESILNSKIFHV